MATTTAQTERTTIPAEGTITTSGTIASLPPCLLWAASITASTDASKGVLTTIDVRVAKDGRIRIASSDGHRATRIYLPQDANFWISSEQTTSIRLDPKGFAKAPSNKRQIAAIKSDGLAMFEGVIGRDRGMTEAIGWQSQQDWKGCNFPNIDQLWPEDRQLTCNPGKAIAFNPCYLADAGRVCAALSDQRALKILTREAITPAIFRFPIDGGMLLYQNIGSKLHREYKEDNVFMDILIMPVQIRD